MSLLPGNANFGDIPSTLIYVDMDLYIFAFLGGELKMGPKRNIFAFVFIFSYLYIYIYVIYSQGLESKYKRERCVFLGVEDVLRDKNGRVTRKKRRRYIWQNFGELLRYEHFYSLNKTITVTTGTNSLYPADTGFVQQQNRCRPTASRTTSRVPCLKWTQMSCTNF